MSTATERIRDEIRARWDPEFDWLPCTFTPWAHPKKPVSRSRVALITTGGVYLKYQDPFAAGQPWGDPTFRELPNVVEAEDLRLAHEHYDRSYAEADVNVVFPMERMRELARQGAIGELAPLAYSFHGYVTRPAFLLADAVPNVVERLVRAQVDVALVCAVSPVCHQTAALIARAVEAAGIATVTLGVLPEVWDHVRPPRAVWCQHPVGATLGEPGNAGKQQQVLRDALAAVEEMVDRGEMRALPYRWHRD